MTRILLLAALLAAAGCGGGDEKPPAPAAEVIPDPMPPAKMPKGAQGALPQ